MPRLSMYSTTPHGTACRIPIVVSLADIRQHVANIFSVRGFSHSVCLSVYAKITNTRQHSRFRVCLTQTRRTSSASDKRSSDIHTHKHNVKRALSATAAVVHNSTTSTVEGKHTQFSMLTFHHLCVSVSIQFSRTGSSSSIVCVFGLSTHSLNQILSGIFTNHSSSNKGTNNGSEFW